MGYTGWSTGFHWVFGLCTASVFEEGLPVNLFWATSSHAVSKGQLKDYISLGFTMDGHTDCRLLADKWIQITKLIAHLFWTYQLVTD